MLSITYINKEDDYWNVGEPYPDVDFPKVLIVTATGNELDIIKREFENLPVLHSRQYTSWVNDTARMISANLSLIASHGGFD